MSSFPLLRTRNVKLIVLVEKRNGYHSRHPPQLDEPTGEPRSGGVPQRRGLPEPGGSVAGGVRGVGREVAPDIRTTNTCCPSAEVN